MHLSMAILSFINTQFTRANNFNFYSANIQLDTKGTYVQSKLFTHMIEIQMCRVWISSNTKNILVTHQKSVHIEKNFNAPSMDIRLVTKGPLLGIWYKKCNVQSVNIKQIGKATLLLIRHLCIRDTNSNVQGVNDYQVN